MFNKNSKPYPTRSQSETYKNKVRLEQERLDKEAELAAKAEFFMNECHAEEESVAMSTDGKVDEDGSISYTCKISARVAEGFQIAQSVDKVGAEDRLEKLMRAARLKADRERHLEAAETLEKLTGSGSREG